MLLALLLLAQIDVPHTRMASGTSWQPDETPMRAVHVMSNGWMIMLHGAATLAWDGQAGPRGGHDVISTNWVMGQFQHSLFGGDAALRTMFSLEPATVPAAGFPLLLQTGESYNGLHLHDVQHPHDLFMEIALDYRRPLNDWLGIEVYGGPAGEPALGPVAFMHRASAEDDPMPPIGHHWQDSTHITFGVATLGLYTSSLKLEGSWFNGREPDQNRWNIDLASFDSYSLRLSAIPDEHVAVQVSYGYLANPEQLPGLGNAVSRVTASVQVSASGVDATAIWGRNIEGTPLDSFLLEGRVELPGGNTPFFRLERVDKTAFDLSVPSAAPDTAYAVHEATLGFVHHFPRLGPVQPAAGARGSLNFVPEDLSSLYGGRVQPGLLVYFLLQARKM